MDEEREAPLDELEAVEEPADDELGDAGSNCRTVYGGGGTI